MPVIGPGALLANVRGATPIKVWSPEDRPIDPRFRCPACGRIPEHHPTIDCDIETAQDVVDAACAFHKISHLHGACWTEVHDVPGYELRRKKSQEVWCECGKIINRMIYSEGDIERMEAYNYRHQLEHANAMPPIDIKEYGRTIALDLELLEDDLFLDRKSKRKRRAP
jgi:hypothetical protein